MPNCPLVLWDYAGALEMLNRTDEAHASTEKVKALGGKVIMEVQEIPNVGWFSVIMDPTGAALALFKPKAM